LVAKAVGKGGENVRQISGILKKRIKVIPQPGGEESIKSFIENIVSPVTFKDVEIKDNEVILDAGGTQSKASLIGRNKRRFLEMQKIIENYFGKEFRII
jgi:transcription antitermination factor NusA-like protein